MLNKTITCLLAGGAGSRLKPLTLDRAKPAVPFGGKYRIIDFTLCNCLHSGLRRILVMTQYKSHSLQKHLRDGWSIFNPELGDYITVVPAQMREGEKWYQGTADAIWQNRYILKRSDAKYVLILSGDHIYRMDYAAMLNAHAKKKADVTIACMEVPLAEAKSFGVMGIDNDKRIVTFREKPDDPDPIPGKPDQALVSMGIYVFSIDLLLDSLRRDADDVTSSRDFGHDVLPYMIDSKNVYAYEFGGKSGRVSCDKYWRDVGTIDAFYEANMDLLKPIPPLDLYQTDWPIRTHQIQVPPARTVPGASGNEGIFINSIVAGGAIIAGGSVQNSIMFPKVFIGDESLIENSILFEGARIGDNCRLNNCIIEKYVNVPDNTEIGIDLKKDKEKYHVSEKGIVVIAKDDVVT